MVHYNPQSNFFFNHRKFNVLPNAHVLYYGIPTYVLVSPGMTRTVLMQCMSYRWTDFDYKP